MRLNDKGLDHWRGVVWDPGIVGQQCVYVCYDCLSLMALFRVVMLLVHDWAAWSVWTGTESGYCRKTSMVIGLFDCGGGPAGCSDWLSVRGVVVVCPGGSQDHLYKGSADRELFT